ncbi:MAG: signal peptide peptidase SppA [candidate division Zixibacteria bacterium]|nr:signal peptide peptidase SppA [candidate division Zixibacteria bacterium]
MARRRDIVAGVIIAVAFIFVFGWFGLTMSGFLGGGGDLEFTSGNIGLVEVNGIIDEELGRTAIKQLDRFAESNSIKAIIVHVNSPGGGVAISQEIYDAIKRAKEEKPVVAAFASVAASGGYYIACAADKVVANPGTITGSIGVIFQFHTVTGLLGKIGVETETVKSGELKDVGSYARPMTEKEELMLRAVVMDSYEQFVSAVAEGRELEKDQIYPLADGSIFTGLQAYNLGLIDTLGGLKEAIDLAASLAALTGKPKLVRPLIRDKGSIFDLVQSTLGKVNKSVDNSFSGPQLLYLFQ